MARITESISLAWPCPTLDVDRWKETRKRERHSAWVQLTQCKGVGCFRGNDVGNRVAFLPGPFSGEEIDLLRMRSNTFPIKEYLGRQDQIDTTCRRCHSAPETLGHVLGACPAGRGVRRIRRHNDIVDAIESQALLCGLTCAKGQLFETNEGNDEAPVEGQTEAYLRPDLVIRTPGGALIVDVSVRFEQEESLKDASREKKAKYRPITAAVKRSAEG